MAQQAYMYGDWVEPFYKKVCCISTLTDVHYASVHTCTGVVHCLHTCMGIVHLHVHAYRRTHVGLYTCLGIGVLVYMVYKHTLSGFTPINMLVYLLTDTRSSFIRVCGDWAFFITCFTNLHLQGLQPRPTIRHARVHSLGHTYSVHTKEDSTVHCHGLYTRTRGCTRVWQYRAAVQMPGKIHPQCS